MSASHKAMLFEVSMEWNEEQAKWLMCAPNGDFIYDYQDCGNVHKYFLGELDKEKKKWFRVTMETMESGKLDTKTLGR